MFNNDLINNYIKEQGLSKQKFCKMCKISVGTLNKVLLNKDNVGIIALFKIARVLNIRICELFE